MTYRITLERADSPPLIEEGGTEDVRDARWLLDQFLVGVGGPSGGASASPPLVFTRLAIEFFMPEPE